MEGELWVDSMCICGGGKIMGWFIAYMSGDGTCVARVDGDDFIGIALSCQFFFKNMDGFAFFIP